MIASSVDWGALATAVAACVAAIGTYFNGRRGKATHGLVVEVDKAVNGKPPGDQTMVSQVQDLHDDRTSTPVSGGIRPMLEQLTADVGALTALASDVAAIKEQLGANGGIR